jgi:hypothetical protein
VQAKLVEARAVGCSALLYGDTIDAYLRFTPKKLNDLRNQRC